MLIIIITAIIITISLSKVVKEAIIRNFIRCHPSRVGYGYCMNIVPAYVKAVHSISPYIIFKFEIYLKSIISYLNKHSLK